MRERAQEVWIVMVNDAQVTGQSGIATSFR